MVDILRVKDGSPSEARPPHRQGLPTVALGVTVTARRRASRYGGQPPRVTGERRLVDLTGIEPVTS